MGIVRNDEQAKVTKAILVTPDALDFAVKGFGALATRLKESIGEMPYVVELQIVTATEYLDMLMAQPDISVEKDAYLTGVGHGALIAIWRHLEALGYVADAEIEKIPVVSKKKRNVNPNSKK